jgi:hypothetical protein
MAEFEIVREPRGRAFKDLIAHSLTSCDEFLIALTHRQLSDHAQDTLKELNQYLITCEEVTEYPAGVLPWGTIQVCRYLLSPGSAQVLQNAATGLYDWVEPDLPNDLCLMRGRDPWLITMASDRLAVIISESSDIALLKARIPSITLRERAT